MEKTRLTKFDDLTDDVFYYLLDEAYGEKNAKTAPEICDKFGCTAATLRNVVNYLRSTGNAIGSGIKGYFFCSTKSEVEQTIKQLAGRIAGITEAINGLEAIKGDFR